MEDLNNLEFGNIEQINILNSMKTKKRVKNYQVTFGFSGSYSVEVEAETEEEAIKKAREEPFECEEIDDVYLDYIKEIK